MLHIHLNCGRHILIDYMMSVKIVSGEASESDEEFPATSLPSPSVSASPLHRPRTDGRETPDSKAKNSPSRKKHYTHRDDKRGEKVYMDVYISGGQVVPMFLYF